MLPSSPVYFESLMVLSPTSPGTSPGSPRERSRSPLRTGLNTPTSQMSVWSCDNDYPIDESPASTPVGLFSPHTPPELRLFSPHTPPELLTSVMESIPMSPPGPPPDSPCTPQCTPEMQWPEQWAVGFIYGIRGNGWQGSNPDSNDSSSTPWWKVKKTLPCK